MDTSPGPGLHDLLAKLQQKYDVMGQDVSSYLDGLLHADYLTYWDYVHVDTLLSLQNPKTQLPDEKVFIVYHQDNFGPRGFLPKFLKKEVYDYSL